MGGKRGVWAPARVSFATHGWETLVPGSGWVSFATHGWETLVPGSGWVALATRGWETLGPGSGWVALATRGWETCRVGVAESTRMPERKDPGSAESAAGAR